MLPQRRMAEALAAAAFSLVLLAVVAGCTAQTATPSPVPATATPTPIAGVDAPILVGGVPVQVIGYQRIEQTMDRTAADGYYLVEVKAVLPDGDAGPAEEWEVELLGADGASNPNVTRSSSTIGSRATVGWVFAVPEDQVSFRLVIDGSDPIDLSSWPDAATATPAANRP